MRRSVMTAAVTLTALAAAACGPEQAADDPDERVAELEQRLDAAEQEADELRADKERLEAEIAALRDEEDEPADDPPPRPAGPRTEEGLTEQLWLRFDDDAAPEEWEPGTTDWEPFELPDGVEGPYEEPGLAAAAVLEHLEAPALGLDVWEATTRILLDEDDPDRAVAAVLSWGWADDAVAGRDVRIPLSRTEDGWVPESAEVRHHCRRGVTDDGLCV